MKSYTSLTICALLFASISAQALPEDTVSVQQKLIETGTSEYSFRNQIWKNPSLNYYRQDFNLTTLRLDGRYAQRGEASIVQEGTGYKDFDINVSSFVTLSERDKVFGTASYRNGHRENVRWNENADFSIIYPYVTGDSIGGYLKSETYDFSGGYAHRWNSWTLGTQLSYRASLSYRDKDPRPRNVVSDLNFTVSAVHTFGQSHLFGASLNVRKYNQKSSIAFLADKGATPVYQMLGLGVDYVRFAGTQTSSNHSGTGLGGSIDLLPVNGNGLSVSLVLDYFKYTKELTNINNAPINEMKEYKLGSEVAWMHSAAEGLRYGMKLNASVSLRDGVENIFGDPTGNVYPIISSASQSKNVNAQAVLTGLLEKTLVGEHSLGWSVMPVVGYGLLKSEYKSYARSVDIVALRYGLQAQAMWKRNDFLLTAGAGGGYTSNLKSAYSLPGLNTVSSVAQALLSNIRYLSDNNASIALSLRGDYAITSQYTAFLSGRWQHQMYKVCGSTNYGELSLGFIF